VPPSSGPVTSSADADRLVGRLVDGRYDVRERVARGGMATVYRALDTRLGRVVALKVMHRHLADDEAFASRFVREARAVARLNNPGVVAVFDQGEDDGSVYLAMELVPGRTLRDVVRDEAPLPALRAVGLVERVAGALAAAHSAGIVHRDVKPENVLLGDDGAVKVADFGLARALQSGAGHSTATATGGLLIGTVAYLAPELVVGEGADPRSDVYACGIVLYELLTGSKPHVGDTPIQVAYQHVHTDVPPPSQALPTPLPDYVDAVVARATARDRDLRPTDAGVLVRQLAMVRSALGQGLGSDAELAADLRPPPSAPAGSTLPTPFPLADTAGDAHGVSQVHTPVATPVPAAIPRTSAVPTRTERDTSRTDPRRRRRRGRLLLALVLVLALAAGLAGWWFGVGRFTDTPRLLQLTEREAAAEAGDVGLAIEVIDTAYSETVPKGTVVGTEPAAGDPIEDGGTVGLTLSQGKERYPVPAVTGVPRTDAAELLRAAQLRVGDVRRDYHPTVAEGSVISASIDAETRVKPETRVDLWVSRGPRPIPIDDYTGQDAAGADDALTAAGFTVRTRPVFDDAVGEGLVVAQTPSSGTGFRDQVVRLVVSKGPQLVEVPSVTGAGLTDARAELAAADFAVRERQSELYTGLGFVVQQSPAGGTLAPARSRVVIFLV